MANVNFATNPGLVPKLPYDTAKDFAAVSLLATSPSVLVVHPSLPVRSVKELITLARANPASSFIRRPVPVRRGTWQWSS